MRWTAIVVVGALVRAAHADAVADALFQQGLDERAAGHHDAACAKFRESFERNREAVGAMINVALCDEEAGKIASAHKLFAEAAERAREQHAQEHLDAAEEHKHKLAADVPRLTIAFADPAPEMKLVVDGELVDTTSTNDLEVDPGSAKVVVSAPGRVPYETTVTLAKGEHKAIAIPKLGYPIEDKGRATLGLVITIAGAGVALSGVGVGFYANHKYNAEFDNGHCTMKDAAHPVCSQDGLAATHSAKSLGWVGTGVGIAGVVAIGVGVTLWLTAPHHERARQVSLAPTLAPGEAGVVAFGHF